ncbi:hypothetical protein [Paractinoplanes durhamensis]
MDRSEWQTPAALIRTRTWPGPISGRRSSATAGRSPAERTTTPLK